MVSRVGIPAGIWFMHWQVLPGFGHLRLGLTKLGNWILDLTPDDKKPAESMLATKDKKVKQVTFKDPIAEFGQAKLEMHKVRKNLPVHKPKSQPGRPLGLRYSQ